MALRVTHPNAASNSLTSRPQFLDSKWIIPLLLLAVTVAVFAAIFICDFVSWDDKDNLFKNPSFNPPTVAGIARYWVDAYLDLYIPLTYSVWGILAAIAWMPHPDSHGIQLDPHIFHAANLGLHLVAVYAAYAMLLRLSGRRWPAAAGALLFAIHPLQVEPVAWATGMKDVLCGALSLISLWQYICFADARRIMRHGSRPWLNYSLAIVCFVLALLAKPSAVTVPWAAIVLDRWMLRRPARKVFLAAGPMLGISAGWALFTSTLVQTVHAPADGGRLFLRPLIATDAMAFYLYKLLLPIKLGFHYNRSPLTVIQSGWVYYTWLAPAFIVVLMLLFRKKASWLLPSAALFLIGVAPVLGLIPFAFQRFATVADRYVYVSMLGPALALAAILRAATGPDTLSLRAQRTVVVMTAAALTLLGLRSFVQVFVWRSNAALFANALWVNPSSFAANDGMAAVLVENHRLDEAKGFAQRAAACAPGQPDGYIMLGTIYTRLGDMPKATESFRKAVVVSPKNPDALDALGGALAAGRDFAEAENLLRQAIKIRPEMADAHANLGVLLFQTRRYEEAFNETSLAVRYDPGDINSHWCLFVLLNGHGDRAAAIEQLEIILQIDPNYPHAKEAYMQVTGLHP